MVRKVSVRDNDAGNLTKILLRELGINPVGLRKAQVDRIIRPKLETVFKKISDDFADHVFKSSYKMGGGKQRPISPGDSIESYHQLSRSLERSISFRRSKQGLRWSMTVASNDDRYEYFNNGKPADQTVPISVLLSWAIRTFGWNVPHPGPSVSPDIFFKILSKVKTPDKRTNYGFVFYKLWRQVVATEYRGMELTSHLRRRGSEIFLDYVSQQRNLDLDDLLS